MLLWYWWQEASGIYKGADNGKDAADEVDVEKQPLWCSRSNCHPAFEDPPAVIFAGAPLEVGNGAVTDATDGCFAAAAAAVAVAAAAASTVKFCSGIFGGARARFYQSWPD